MTEQCNIAECGIVKPAEPNNGENAPSANRQKLTSWLGSPVRVVITDGRIIMGNFSCTDGEGNIVISTSVEYLDDGKDARRLGNVMIPGKHIVNISIDCAP